MRVAIERLKERITHQVQPLQMLAIVMIWEMLKNL